METVLFYIALVLFMFILFAVLVVMRYGIGNPVEFVKSWLSLPIEIEKKEIELDRAKLDLELYEIAARAKVSEYVRRKNA